MRLLDAGCGPGRNIKYLLGSGLEVHAVDSEPAAIETTRLLAAEHAPDAVERIKAASIDKLPYPAQHFDVVVAIAILHFASDSEQFEARLRELWRVTAEGGLFFARLASSIGLESRIEKVSANRYKLPDGSTRFLVTEEMLVDYGNKLGAELLEPIKTVNVQGLRCMTTWVLRKPAQAR